MAFTLEQVVPWGREFEEYRRFFRLGEKDLKGPILGCSDGPAEFNAMSTLHGARVVSCDPLYRFHGGEIRARIGEVTPQIMAQTRAHSGQFCWEYFRDADDLQARRLRAMDNFLADYAVAGAAGRYVAGALPHLPFDNGTFRLALVSHFLFLYSEHLDTEFHLRSVTELLRVAREVRLFPLLDLETRPSRHLEPVLQMARAQWKCEVVSVDYQFQRGGDKMLRIWTN